MGRRRMEEGWKKDGRRMEEGWKKDGRRMEEGWKKDVSRMEEGWKKDGNGMKLWKDEGWKKIRMMEWKNDDVWELELNISLDDYLIE